MKILPKQHRTTLLPLIQTNKKGGFRYEQVSQKSINKKIQTKSRSADKYYMKFANQQQIEIRNVFIIYIFGWF